MFISFCYCLMLNGLVILRAGACPRRDKAVSDSGENISSRLCRRGMFTLSFKINYNCT